MKSIFFSCFFALWAFFLNAQTADHTLSVYFDHDRSELTPESQKALDILALKLLEAPDCAVQIDAYTDDWK
jgi:outer membrane protein OmpA-like peptidoglycan-associated protein